MYVFLLLLCVVFVLWSMQGGKGDDDTGGLAGQGDLMKDLLSGSLHSSDNDKYKKRDTSEDSRNRQAYRSGAVSVHIHVQ